MQYSNKAMGECKQNLQSKSSKCSNNRYQANQGILSSMDDTNRGKGGKHECIKDLGIARRKNTRLEIWKKN